MCPEEIRKEETESYEFFFVVKLLTAVNCVSGFSPQHSCSGVAKYSLTVLNYSVPYIFNPLYIEKSAFSETNKKSASV